MTRLTERPAFRRGESATRPEVQERLRRFVGAKGLPDVGMDERIKAVIDVAHLEDPFYARDPQFWMVSSFVAAAAGNLSKVGILTRNDPKLVWVVDEVVCALGVNDAINVGVTVGGAAILVYTIDGAVTLRNRGDQEQGGTPTRTGDSRIIDNSLVGIGTQIFAQTVAGNAQVRFPLGYRLFASEQLVVSTATVNEAITATLYGRVGQR